MKNRVLFLVMFLVCAGVFVGLARAEELKGKVVEVNEEGKFVLIDLGAVNGIKLSQEFSVTKNGEEIAVFKVLGVRNEVSACDAGEDFGEIRMNDVLVLKMIAPRAQEILRSAEGLPQDDKSGSVEAIMQEKKLLLDSLTSSEAERRMLENENRELKKKMQELEADRGKK